MPDLGSVGRPADPGGHSKDLASQDHRPVRVAIWLPVIILLAFVVRMLVLVLVAPTPLASDEGDYFARANRVIRGLLAIQVGGRPPLTELFYALFFKIFGTAPSIARAANIFANVGTLLPIFYLGARLGGARVGLLSALLAAIYPNFIAYSNFLWSEPLYIFLSMSGLALLAWHLEKPSKWKLLASGVIFGCGALTREVGLAFALFAACWLVWNSRTRGRNYLVGAGLFMASFILTILPWTMRVNQFNDHFVLLTNTSYRNLFIGNIAEPFAEGLPERTAQYRGLGMTTSERELAARALVLQAISDRMPWWPLEKIADQVPRYFSPNSFTVLRLLKPVESKSDWPYQFKWPELDKRWVRVTAVVAVVAGYVLMVVLGIGGLILSGRTVISGLFGVFMLSQILPPIAAFACSRFRLASMCLFIIGAAMLLLSGRELWSASSTFRRSAAIVAMVAMLMIILVRYSSVLGPVWG
jgi:4-amino-4-deoxy-L-arabinose transferase-like glycosyltransferase